ncbi:MAG: MBOAT family protein [Bacteroidetes bacterium]|nr:MAG: MBOAT family protein [Bacteroidota bacterium]
MIFSTSLFLLYFLPAFLIIYFLLAWIPKSWPKNTFLLLVSIFYYAWGAPLFVFIVLGSVLADFFLLREVGRSEGTKRKVLFWISVLLNLGLLIYFKYMNFFIDQFNVILGWFGSPPAEWTRIALPIGISFITFQKLSCTFDVYKRRHAAVTRFQDYALCIFMFPQLISGPIVRVGQIIGQIHDRRSQENVNERLISFYRFVIGLAKKVLIADVLGVTVNEIFALDPAELSSGLAWIGAIAYAFQIYFDFSGYTDMAIGLAKMAGFRLPENFNFPYISTSITEFWKRWHITLSTWLRDYLFLPDAYSLSRKWKKDSYGGIRTDKLLYSTAVAITFLICGFWHGAAWTFILWGGYMACFLILDRLFLIRWMKKAGRIPAILLTFLLLVIGWVIFRSDSLDAAFFYIGRMFGFVHLSNAVWLSSKFWTVLGFAIIFSFWGGWNRIGRWSERLFNVPGSVTVILMTILAILLFILSEATVTSSGFSPFIYFRF